MRISPLLLGPVLVLSAGSGQARAQKQVAPNAIECTAKPYPNLPDKAAAGLTRQPDGTYKVEVDNFGKRSNKAKLSCVFRAGDPLIFTCRTPKAAWGIESMAFTEKAVDADGKSIDRTGVAVQGIRNPEGEASTEFNLRFPDGGCVAK